MSLKIEPDDVHNRALVGLVHPADWRNPRPTGRYDLVVMGGGTAGLVTAAAAAGLGARVALIERYLLGGDCLNVGCVPSKTLLRSAQAAADVRRAERLGIRIGGAVSVDFAAVMERVRRLRAGLAPHDSAARFRDLGVDVFLGAARFQNRTSVVVDGQELRFHRAVIATGARAVLPNVPGLADGGCLSNENVFNLTVQPRRLAILGGGPIGCELAQAFARLGTEVILLHRHGQLLDREDPDAAAVLAARLQSEGVRLVLNAELKAAERNGSRRRLTWVADGVVGEIEVDAVLAAAGRAPNVEDLGLEAAGVQFDSHRGVVVDDFLRTTRPEIYACGDVCLAAKFTHAADFAARLVVQNALFSVGPFGRRRWSSLTVPWCTYTDPEIAQVGLSEPEARARGIAVTTFQQALAKVDRAVTDDATEGFVKIHVRAGTDVIVGATVVARNAGDLISELSVAIAGRVGLGRLAGVIHPYPTQAEAIRKCGDLYNRTRLTPRAAVWLKRWLVWRRGSS